MTEQIIKFTNVDVDGCGTDVPSLARIYGNAITTEITDRVKNAICGYIMENERIWDTNGCLAVAQKQLEAEGYEVHWIYPCTEICF